MARKRNELKENIFVTNEYFEKYGVSRQVIEYQRNSGKIHSIGIYMGMNLFFRLDADILILRYWINRFRKFIGEWEKTQKIKDEAKKRIHEMLLTPKNERSVRFGFNDFLGELERLRYEELNGSSSKEYFELRRLIKQYFFIDVDYIYLEKKLSAPLLSINSELDDFFFRVSAYKESDLVLDDYLKKEKAQIAVGKGPYDIFEYFLVKNGNKLTVDEIYNLREDLMRTL